MRNNIYRRLFALVVVLLVAGFAWSDTSGVFQSRQAAFRLEEVESGLQRPWSVAFLPEGDRLITLKGGDLLYSDGSSTEKVAGVPRIVSVGQGGLLDVVTHPDFPRNSIVYFTFSEGPAGRQGTSVARARFSAEPSPRLNDWEVIFSGNNITGGGTHFGSRLVFGTDGMLYVTIGERGQRNRAQDPFDLSEPAEEIRRSIPMATGTPRVWLWNRELVKSGCTSTARRGAMK